MWARRTSIILIALIAFTARSASGAIATDVNISKDNPAASATITSAAFNTATPNELVLAFVAADFVSGTNTTVKSISGAGLTWTLVQRANGQSGSSEIWRAFAAAPLSNVTVAATLSHSVVASLTVMSFAGVNPSGTNGSGAIGAVAAKSAPSGAPIATLVSTVANSWVIGVGNDYDNAIARTLGPNQSLVHQYFTPTGDTYWVQMQTSPIAVSGTTVSINDTAPTKDRYNLAICEILPASTGTPTWSISGNISPAAGGSGATLALSGAASATVTADVNGNYAFAGLSSGSYTVTPSKSGFTFSPVSQPVTVNGANQTGVNFTATGLTWSISGNISPAAGGGGAAVALSGAASASTTADANGNYTFSGLANGSYTVTPSKSGYTFSPVNKPVTLSGANQTGINFTAQAVATTWSISGNISPAAGGSGTTVALSGASSATTTADANGNYTFSGLANGSYTVTPSKSGYTFSPVSLPVTVNGANQTGINFTAQAVATTWSISGILTPAAGGGGATVALSGASSATTTADANGNYTFSGLANGSYTVTPSKSGYTFTPPNQAVTVNGTNMAGVNFTAQSATASGIQLIQANVNGNESTASSMSVAFANNNTAGNFVIVSGTIARPAGTLSISDTLGNTYIPVTSPVTDTNQDVTSYLWYVPSCKGGANTVKITPSVGGALEIHVSEWSGISTTNPVDVFASATGTGTNASSGTVTTTADGELVYGYTFLYNTATAGAGFTGMTLVSGDLDEYQVQPAAGSVAATFTQTSGSWFARVATFRPANAPQSAISGTISPAVGGSGATVALSGAASATTTADASGNYTFAGVANGSYVVTPSKTGYAFSPASQPVTVNGTSQTGVNFTAQGTGPTWSISGVITPAAGGSGATVALSGTSSATTTTDANGNYTFAGLVNGTYSVAPSKNGYTFNPVNQSVTLGGADASGVNFTAVAPSGSITVDVNLSKNNAASATVTSAAFSTSTANELLLAFVATDFISGTNTTVKSIAGAGLTWTLVQRTNAQSGSSEIWRAFAAVPLSNVTVAATLSQSVISSLTVMSFVGVNTSGTNGSGAIGAVGSQNAASGAPTATLITTGSNSWVLGVGNDYDNAVTRTLGAAQTLVHQYLTPTGDTYWVQMHDGAVSLPGTSVTINDTAPTKDRYNLSLVEVLAGSGGGNATPPTVSMTSPAPGALVSSLVTVSATASDPVSIAGVQFLLDGAPLGAEITIPPYSFTWDTTKVPDGPHTLAARARDSVGLTTLSTPVSITVSNTANAAQVGTWSSVVSLPTVAVNLVLLRNNRVLFYEDGSTPTVWDYVQNTFTNVPTTENIFCSGHALLADGRLLVVGGYGDTSSTIGIKSAEIFDPVSLSWTPVPDMQYRRWYPTATTLSDGRVLVTAGWQTTAHTNAGISEIYNPTTNSWTSLTNANNPFETYPFLYLLPDGRVIHIGGSEYPTDTDVLDLNTTTWTVVDPNIVDGGSATMYQPGKFMKAGSATDSQDVGPSSNTTFVLDMTQPSPAWRQTASMAYPRSFLNLTMLPDGTVLATGGETDRNGGTIANAVYAAELWSPQTETWSTMSSMHTPREYHGTALLLPDGRVLVSGMGFDFGNVPDEKSAEFYSPPYLFKGARPTITQSPSQIQYGSSFFVGTPDAASIASVSLIRTGAVTHFFDENERFLPLSFTQASGGLTVTAPVNANLAPPGYYMLFIVNSAGVPSIAPFVQVP